MSASNKVAQLKVFSQPVFKETVFPIFQGDNFIGRGGKCNITIPVKALSNKHACIEVQGDVHLIRDCESKNKTKKGKSFLKPTVRYELRHGDILTLGGVKCQYLVEKIGEEGKEDETGSETRSESMLPEVNTEEEKEDGKVLLAVTKEEATEIPREDVRVEQVAKDYKPSGLSKEEAEAYAADTDYDTNEEGAPAATTVALVFYSSDVEQETPARFKTARTAALETVQKSEVNEDPEVSYNTDKSANLGEVASEDENNMESEVLEDDSATQPYVADRNFESESETIPVMDGNVEGKFDRNPLCKDYDIEATPGYYIKDLDDENDEDENQDSEDSTTANSQRLPIGPNVVASHKDDDDVAATLAYGREATQAYVTGKDDNTDTENDSKEVNMQPNDLQATQAYGIQCSGDNMDDDDGDDKEERTEKESRKEEIHEQFEVPAAKNGIDRGDTIQATTSYNIEGLQTNGGYESDETDDEDAIDKDKGSEEVNKVDKDRTSVTCGLPETLHNGEDDKGGVDHDINKDNTRADHSFLKPPERRKINAKLECALEETQAYNGGSIDTDPAPSVVIEANQAYGIEEHSDEKMAAAIIPKPSKVGKDRNEEVKETPAPRSRRGKRGRTAFAESALILETPLNKATGSKGLGNSDDVQLEVVTPTPARGKGRRKSRGKKTQVATDEPEEVEAHSLEESIECQLETLEEPKPLKGRGKGKGRGKKNQTTAVKEKMEVEAHSLEESIECQLETLEEPKPLKGRGKGKGRGKKNQTTAVKEKMEVEAHSLEESIECQLETLEEPKPLKGRGKGKGRGKKNQTTAVKEKMEVEAHSLEESIECQLETLEEPKPLKGRGKGKGRGKKNQTTAVKEKMSAEDLSETLFNPGSSEGSKTRKGRGRHKEVKETPAKKSRCGKEPFIFESQSPSLHQEKLAGESNPRVIFTGPRDKQGEKVVTSLGGQLVNDVDSCTHLVTDKVRRTVKFLCGLSRGVIIVQPSWLEACKKAKSFVDTSPFLVKDRDAEEQFKFDLQRSREAACRQGLLEGYKVHVTKGVKPEPSQMKDIIHSAKGEFLSSIPRSIKDKRVFVISCNEDRSVLKKLLEAGIPVVSAEILLTGILRQELNLEEHKLFVEETNEATQDHTLGESKMIKRRRELSDAAASSPTVEPKRRKR
ncbi:mediator of DNA damage checkpoint protein 1-like isoform X2 [Montipora foliosa]|uniref:mediator of DNA damage checkpoint protein 1-like isoform X2 n=1 Tax=Montipora foliosa TaxID=591990 RepID=UPI0035F1FCDF